MGQTDQNVGGIARLLVRDDEAGPILLSLADGCEDLSIIEISKSDSNLIPSMVNLDLVSYERNRGGVVITPYGRTIVNKLRSIKRNNYNQ